MAEKVRGRGSGVIVISLQALVVGGLLVGCSPSSAEVLDSASSSPSEQFDVTPEPTPAPSLDANVSALPAELHGQWSSLDQGDAQTSYRFVSDGTYDEVSVLVQDRPNGLFQFTVQITGVATVSGDQLTLTPVSGTQQLTDPGDPNGNFDKPLTDLRPRVFSWSLAGDRLVLTGEFGTVPFARPPEV